MRTIILIILLTVTNSTIASTYGPTKSGDLLWNIAGKVRPNTSITRYQAMLALLKANPHAFQISCNLNTLKTGKILQIPSNMQELTSKEAVNEFYRQRDEWVNFRKKNKQIICQLVEERSIIKIPTIKNLVSEPDIETKVKITSTETFETVIPEEIDIKKPSTSITQVLVTEEPDKIEDLTLIQFIWNDIQIWFYNLSYLHQVIFLALIILFSISLLLLLFASIFRSKKSIDKKDTIDVEITNVLPDKSDDNVTKPSDKSEKMKEKLDTVRAYLAEDEAQRIKKLLREVMQNGDDEQRVEAQQLYEINKKISYLKLTDTQAINTNLKSVEQINKIIPAELSIAKNEEQAFNLIDKVFMMFDEELSTQGKLLDSYIARQQEITEPNVADYENNYQVVEEDSLKRPELKSTRKL
ncbi:FimV/HubP family polar landmark protein [Candidatus Halobeggiatoa sp. HSG11]|nr:FimV/HubP family polar landmark protein [Candidatus Halobeggiatoa sp. HSG11]